MALNKKQFIFLFLLVIVTFFTFYGSLFNDFLVNWDDNFYILNNPYIKTLSWQNTVAIFSTYWNENYHPLTTFVFAFEYNLFGTNPLPYHLLQLLIHLANSVLVFRLVFVISRRIDVSSVTALIFGIHPMHVESVAWISETKDTLYAFFFLGALLLYVHYIMQNRRVLLRWSLVLFVFSLLSKSAAVTLPLLFFAFDYYFRRKISVRLITEKIPFFLLSFIFGVIALQSQKEAVSDISGVYSITDRIFIVFYSFAFYCIKFFFPFFQSAIYYYPVKNDGLLPLSYYLSPALILFFFYVYRKSKWLKRDIVFGLGFFLITLILVLQIIPFGNALAADRYTYLSYIGLLFISGRIFQCIRDEVFSFSRKIKPFLYILCFGFFVFFIIQTRQRIRMWENGEILFSDVIAQYPENGFAYDYRGFAKACRNDIQGAVQDYDNAIEMGHQVVKVSRNRSRLLPFINEYNTILLPLDNRVNNDAGNGENWFLRGTVKAAAPLNDHYGAMEDYNIAIELGFRTFYTYYNRGNAKKNLRLYKEAIRDYNQVIEIKPDFSEVYNNRGISYYYTGQYRQAVSDFTKALKRQPGFTEALFNRGNAWFYWNKKNNACSDWKKAFESGHPKAKENLSKYCR